MRLIRKEDSYHKTMRGNSLISIAAPIFPFLFPVAPLCTVSAPDLRHKEAIYKSCFLFRLSSDFLVELDLGNLRKQWYAWKAMQSVGSNGSNAVSMLQVLVWTVTQLPKVLNPITKIDSALWVASLKFKLKPGAAHSFSNIRAISLGCLETHMYLSPSWMLLILSFHWALLCRCGGILPSFAQYQLQIIRQIGRKRDRYSIWMDTQSEKDMQTLLQVESDLKPTSVRSSSRRRP